jgi:FkbM family methyltransferase
MKFERTRRSLSASTLARAVFYPAIALRRALLRHRTAIREEVIRNLRDSLAEDPIVHLEEFEGDFALDPRSHLFTRIASEGRYEPELAACCVARLDGARDALDIGANVGFYANLFAKRLGASRRVLAVEPTPNALNRLRSNVARNLTTGKIVIFDGVASDFDGELTLNTVAGREEYSSLGPIAHPSIRDSNHISLRVRSMTVDRLVDTHGLEPGFVKIDVEGSEAKVLQGARETLRRFRPIVLCELSDSLLRQNGSSAPLVVEFMRALGYKVSDPQNEYVEVGTRAFGDMLCVPQSP